MTKETDALLTEMVKMASQKGSLHLTPFECATVERAATLIRLQESLLLYVLWHHQGGSSVVGHVMRKHLGIGEFASLTAKQLAAAKSVSPDGTISPRKEPQP